MAIKKLDLLIQVGVGIITIIISILIVSFIHSLYCHNWGDKYTQDSTCFDVNFRCEVECDYYNEQFNGTIERCMCMCEEGSVSICSGFYYEYEG